MHSDMAKKRTYSRNGDPITLGAEHVTAFVTNTMIKIDDWITRDRERDLQKIMNAMTVTKDILLGLGSPDPAVRMARAYLKTSGVKDVDEILPDPDKVDANPVPPGLPSPGQPRMVPGMPSPDQPMGEPVDATAQAPENPLA